MSLKFNYNIFVVFAFASFILALNLPVKDEIMPDADLIIDDAPRLDDYVEYDDTISIASDSDISIISIDEPVQPIQPYQFIPIERYPRTNLSIAFIDHFLLSHDRESTLYHLNLLDSRGAAHHIINALLSLCHQFVTNRFTFTRLTISELTALVNKLREFFNLFSGINQDLLSRPFPINDMFLGS